MSKKEHYAVFPDQTKVKLSKMKNVGNDRVYIEYKDENAGKQKLWVGESFIVSRTPSLSA